MKIKHHHQPHQENILLYAAILIVHINSFTLGVTFCWSTTVTPRLESNHPNPLDSPLTVNEISWLASFVSFGAIFGALTGIYLSDLFGRKQILIYTAILSALSFLTLAFSRELYLYYIARFFGGICVGIFLLVVPIYVAEITNDDDKFKYLTKLFIVCGNLFCFVVGPYVTIQS
ncbi:Sugar transporter [Popillia japonica]|uniref:Sugar transporter n=1 Tax=Popillia japonica TaxID=7064 RepID=A0AAW1JJC2_POPJA